jgi:hypothetical protein
LFHKSLLIKQHVGRRRLSKIHVADISSIERNTELQDTEPLAYPVGPVALVAIDGLSDGLTLGIAGSIGIMQGAILSGSLAIEMAFTGAGKCSSSRASDD